MHQRGGPSSPRSRGEAVGHTLRVSVRCPKFDAKRRALVKRRAGVGLRESEPRLAAFTRPLAPAISPKAGKGRAPGRISVLTGGSGEPPSFRDPEAVDL